MPNVSGLYAGGISKNFSPELLPNKITNAQIKNKKMNKELSAGTGDEKQTNADSQHVSPRLHKTQCYAPFILDAACGGRMFWFDKMNPDVLFTDVRSESHILCDGRELIINPDLEVDFRNMPFEDEKFKLVVFDPPHLNKLGQNTWMAKKYGVLGFDWKKDIELGFSECFRVLEAYGILIFKWNEVQIKVSDILKLTDVKPLFGHRTAKSGKTIWLCFMKLPRNGA